MGLWVVEAILSKMAREDLIIKKTIEQRKRVRELAMLLFERRNFKEEGTAGAKALKLECI